MRRWTTVCQTRTPRRTLLRCTVTLDSRMNNLHPPTRAAAAAETAKGAFVSANSSLVRVFHLFLFASRRARALPRTRTRTHKRFVTHAHLVVLTRHSTFSPTPSRSNRTRNRTAALPSTAPCVCGTRVRRRVKPFRTATCAACWTWRLRRISNPSSPRRTTTPRACSAWCRSWRENGAFRERVCLNSIHTDRLYQSLVARRRRKKKAPKGSCHLVAAPSANVSSHRRCNVFP